MHPLTKLVLVLLVVALAGVTLYVANQRRHEGQSGGPEAVSTPVEQAAEGRRPFQDPLATYERWRNRLGERQAAPTSESPRPPAIDLQSSSVNEGTVVAQRLETPVAGADPPGPTLKPAGVEGEVVTARWTETEAAAKDNTYVIAAGDTLYGIAMKRYGDPKFVSAIEAANPGIDARALRVGDRIVLPERQAAESEPEAAAAAAAPKVYVVRRNDTLIGIARRFYGDAAAYRKIYEANRDVLSSPNATLYVGMRLRLPEP
jgi:nucleoid-associated protein YgaU